jgi:hypothetical protein
MGTIPTPSFRIPLPNITFRMEAGRMTLMKFIEVTQACVRPRREIPPENHS